MGSRTGAERDSRLVSQPSFLIWHVNCQGLMSHLSEIAARLQLASVMPGLLCLNETFLDRSVSDLSLPYYDLVARRDRTDGRRCGGVAVYALSSIASSVTVCGISPVAERVWVLIHSDCGPFLVACWYRPPEPGDTSFVQPFCSEFREHSSAALGSIVVGDVNCHNIRWLRHSSRNSPEGIALLNACLDLGLTQRVRSPTRGDNLLDLVLSDVSSLTCRVLPPVADHNVVEVALKFSVPHSVVSKRVVWDFGKANWTNIIQSFASQDFCFLDVDFPNHGGTRLTQIIIDAMTKFIPRRVLVERKSTHPWMNSKVLRAVAFKQNASGTTAELEASKACSEVILTEFKKFVDSTRDRLHSIRRGSKQWWGLARQLLNQRSKSSNIPALKTSAGQWIMDPHGKSVELASCFASKFGFRPARFNEHSRIYPARAQQGFFQTPTAACANQVLSELRLDSATGPDRISARLLHMCSHVLAEPVAKLARRIADAGVWPDLWRVHWIVPLHKRRSRHVGDHYRGVHLTSQLSKVVERVLGLSFLPYLHSALACGPQQFAYLPGRGSRDATAYLVMTWIIGFDSLRKFGVYCSDVSGAFDRVSRHRLLRKLRAKGLHDVALGFLASWLQSRTAHVVVEGATSGAMALDHMVFQGTVWGPPLWNVFFEDARVPINACGFNEIVYADDLNAFRSFPLAVCNADVMGHIARCQESLHTWGGANGVEFDPGKESCHVVSRSDPHGPDFRILGVMYDTKLLMHSAVQEVVVECAWKLTSLLRSRRYHDVPRLMLLYKAQLLSYIEYRTPAIYHAACSVLAPVDGVQRRFLRETCVSDEQALFEFHLIPLSIRRDIAMLGLIHRTVLGRGPAQFRELFKLAPLDGQTARTRSQCSRHRFQLEDPRDKQHSHMLARSALGLVWVYNHLPPRVVEQASVSQFQAELQRVVKDRAAARCADWAQSLSPRVPLTSHPLLRYR